MKTRHQLIALAGFVLLSVPAGWLLGRFAPRPPQRAPVDPGAGQLDGPAAARVPRAEVGRFYSVDNSDGGYRIIEVLASPPDSLEVRLFGNHFPSRPVAVTASELTLDPSGGYAGPGFDRLTVTPVMFAMWQPEPVVRRAVPRPASSSN